MSFFSYDGAIFRKHGNSKNLHWQIALAKINESPLAVGHYDSDDLHTSSKAEIFNIATNTWTDVDEYPYHSE